MWHLKVKLQLLLKEAPASASTAQQVMNAPTLALSCQLHVEQECIQPADRPAARHAKMDTSVSSLPLQILTCIHAQRATVATATPESPMSHNTSTLLSHVHQATTVLMELQRL